MQRSLFDRPLHRDVLVQMWAVVVGLATLWSARGKVELGGSFNPERAAALVQEAVGAAAGGLLAIVLTALARRLFREEWTDRRAEVHAPAGDSVTSADGRSGTTLDGIRRRYGRRGREWTDAEALRTDIGELAPEPDDHRPRRAPHVVATLDSLATIVGVPVELEWRAEDADHVLVSVLDGRQEPVGSVPLHLERGTDITVTAVNAFGSRTVRTPYVRVLPLPVLTTLALPQAPRIDLRADVAVAVGAGAPALRRLDAVLDEQAVQRARRAPAPVSFATALAQVRAAAAPAVGWRPSGRVWDAVVQPERWARSRRLGRGCRRYAAAAVVATRGWLHRRAGDLRSCGTALRRRGVELRRWVVELRGRALELRRRAASSAASFVARHRRPAPPEPAVLHLSRRLETCTALPSQAPPAPRPWPPPTPPVRTAPPPSEDRTWWTPPPSDAPPPSLPAQPRGRRP